MESEIDIVGDVYAKTAHVENANKIVNVFIDGDKNNFISKSSIQKFKQIVKTPQFKIETINELSNKFMKPGFKLICYENTNNLEYKFKICDAPINLDKTPKDKLRIKINELSKSRKNNNYHKVKSSIINDTDVSVDDIYKEYYKLIKLSKMQIPEPKEILENPDQFKPILSMILGNDMINKLGKNHPYVRYFTLLANKIGVQKEDIEPIHKDINKEIQDVVDMLELKQVVGNTLSDNNDVDTEDEANETDNIDKTDNADNADNADKPDNADNADNVDKTDNADNVDKTDNADNTDNTDNT